MVSVTEQLCHMWNTDRTSEYVSMVWQRATLNTWSTVVCDGATLNTCPWCSSKEYVSPGSSAARNTCPWLISRVVIVVVEGCWFSEEYVYMASQHCRSSSCGVCDGATLSHVKHIVPPFVLVVVARCCLSHVIRTIAGVALVVCVMEQLCHTLSTC